MLSIIQISIMRYEDGHVGGEIAVAYMHFPAEVEFLYLVPAFPQLLQSLRALDREAT